MARLTRAEDFAVLATVESRRIEEMILRTASNLRTLYTAMFVSTSKPSKFEVRRRKGTWTERTLQTWTCRDSCALRAHLLRLCKLSGMFAAAAEGCLIYVTSSARAR